MKNYYKSKEFSCLKYQDVNSLYGWEMSQIQPINGFKQAENTS